MSKINKERFISGNDLGLGRIDVGLEFHKTIDYDRKAMRKALRGGARDVIVEARRLVSRRAISSPGGDPGVVTGRLKRSLGVITKGTKDGWVKVGPRTFSKAGMAADFFYPAVLFYGRRDGSIKKRNNYMVEALQNKRDVVRSQIRNALQQSLVPR